MLPAPFHHRAEVRPLALARSMRRPAHPSPSARMQTDRSSWSECDWPRRSIRSHPLPRLSVDCRRPGQRPRHVGQRFRSFNRDRDEFRRLRGRRPKRYDIDGYFRNHAEPCLSLDDQRWHGRFGYAPKRRWKFASKRYQRGRISRCRLQHGTTRSERIHLLPRLPLDPDGRDA